MFSTWKQRALLGVYIFLILSIPIGAYLVSQQTQTKSKASEEAKIQTPITGKQGTQSASARDQIRDLLLSSPSASASPSASPASTPTTALTFGPTMNFKLSLEGRPAGKQSSKVFIGISEGITSGTQSTYVLSFTVDLPANGTYEGLSLAGLTPSSQYTAFIKPTAQIATSSAFVMSPGITALNSNTVISLLSGDLNEDNVINAADYNIAKSAYNTTPLTVNWNPVADLNVDNIVNNYDLAYILNNMGTEGESGPWISTPTSTSGNLIQNVSTGKPTEELVPQTAPDGTQGYWIWVPKDN